MYKNIGAFAITLVCLIFGAFFLTLGIINYQSSSRTIQNKIENSSLPLLRENIYSVIVDEFIPAVRVASVISHDYFLKIWVENNEQESPEVINYLKEINNEYNYNSTFFVSNQTYKYYTNEGILKVISKEDKADEWYYNFIDSGKTFELNIAHNEDEREIFTIFINHRVEDETGELIGVSGMGIVMDYLSILLREQEKNYNRKVYLVDRSGLVQIHSDLSKINSSNINNTPGIKDISPSILSEVHQPHIESYTLKGKDIIVSSKYIKELGWYLILEHDKSKELDNAKSTLIRTLLVGFVLLLVILTFVILVLNHFNHKLEKIAVTDPLTNIYNRREFDNQIRIHMAKKHRSDTPLTLLSIDIDYFKKVNDTYGHQTGDSVLQKVAALILCIIRPYDILCRLGGDEFIIIIESDAQMVLSLAERLQQELDILSLRSKNNDIINITMSMGIYEAKTSDEADNIIKKADQALYMAKEAGRNCIKIKK